MVKLASQLLDQKVLLMSFENLNLPEKYDGIWACASLLHVRRAELSGVIARLARHFNADGVFYMSLKYGDKEYWQDGRYFNCLDEEGFQKITSQVPELTVEGICISNDGRSNREGERWLNGYLRKN